MVPAANGQGNDDFAAAGGLFAPGNTAAASLAFEP
jgi:hypothetical protein